MRTAIALRYPLLEGAMGLMTAFLFLRFGLSAQALTLVLLTGSLLALAAIDSEWQLLPDTLTYPCSGSGSWGPFLAGPRPFARRTPSSAPPQAVSLWTLYWGHRLPTKREGMGFGDFKLLAAGGAWLGWQALPQVALLAAASGWPTPSRPGSGTARPGQALPFGPFLAAAIWLTAVFGVRWKLGTGRNHARGGVNGGHRQRGRPRSRIISNDSALRW